MRSLFLLLFLLANTITSKAQFTDRYWAFGDSAGIDFKNQQNPISASSVLRSRGTCASISDSIGDLLFYCGSPNVYRWYINPNFNYTLGHVINRSHQLMQNGDSLVGLVWYQEMTIVPYPGNNNLFYIFSAGITSNLGLYYSIVDLSYNGGLGKVVQKNVQLRSDTLVDCVAAVPHGNGRDWWVLVRTWKNVPTNDITAYLVSPSGVTAMPTQYIGPNVMLAGFYRLKFNKQGNHLYNVCQIGGVERYDFDRCTGILSNRHIYAAPNGPVSGYWDFEISNDETKMYTVRTMQGPSLNRTYLDQFDLDTATFLSSARLMATYTEPDRGGALKMGPDGKIYFSIWSAVGDTCYDYLLCHSTSNTTCDNISVINQPDSVYPACDYQAFSFYLGGHKAYAGLPNNPNYELGKWVGSPCDTLSVGVEENQNSVVNLKMYYSVELKTVFLNAEKLTGRNAVVQFYSLNGQLIDEVRSPVQGGYFTYSSSFASQPDGLYIVRLQTEKEVLTGKFVKW